MHLWPRYEEENKYKIKVGREGKERMIPVFFIKNPTDCFELVITLIYRNLSINKSLLNQIGQQGKLVLKTMLIYLERNEIILARSLTTEADTEGILLPNSKILFKSVGQSVIS